MKREEPILIVDSREPEGIRRQLPSFGLKVMTDTLDAGDYLFYPHGLKVLIERKKNSDLLSSLSDGRMVSQAHKLIEQADVALLLVEGRIDSTPAGMVTIETKDGWVESGWSWDSFTGIRLDLWWMGLILHEARLGDAPREIARLVGSLCKDEHKWIRERVRPTVMSIDPQYKNAVWALCAFTGIGPEWADALLKDRGSFECVIAANEEALSKVKDKSGRAFGGKRASKLKGELMQPWS